jgi:sugar lactone lactonase YvrE
MARILATGVLAMAPFAAANPARPEWLDIRPRGGGSLDHPTQAVLMGTRVVVADAGQVKAVTLPEGNLEVLVGSRRTGEPSAPAPGSGRQDAWGLAVDSLGRLTIAQTARHQVLRWTPEAGTQLLLGRTGGRSGRGKAKDQDGKAGPLYGLDRPMGLAAGPDGTIYVADSENHQLLERRQGGRTQVLAGPEPVVPCKGAGAEATVRIRQPRGLVAAPDGSLLFTTASPAGVWRRNRDGAIEPLPGLVDPEAPSFSPSQDSQRHADSLNSPSGLALGPDGSVLVADPLENRVWLQRPAGGKVRVELPPGCGAGGARLISVSGIAHGGVVLTAEGRMWVSFPWREAGEGHPSRGDRDGAPRPGDGKAADPAGHLYRLAAALHAANQPHLPATPGPEAAVLTETKAAPARTGASSGPAASREAGAGSSAAPGAVRVASSQVDAAPLAGSGRTPSGFSQVDAEPPARSKRPRPEASQADAAPLPSAKRPRQGDSMDLRLELSEDQGRPPAASEAQVPALEADGPRDPGQVLRDLLRDEVVVQGLMTFDQADTVAEWLNEQLPGLQPSGAERTSLAERTGLPTSYLGQLLEAVRRIMPAAPPAGPRPSSPVSPLELNPAPPNGNPMGWQD